MNKILLLTPFKVGSSSLIQILRANGYKIIWLHEKNKFVRAFHKQHQKVVIRGHTNVKVELLKSLHFDLIITMIRCPTDMYMSGFFQNITTKEMPFYYGNEQKVLNAKVSDLKEHFLSFNWETFDEYSLNYNFEQIKAITNVNIWNEPFNKEKGFSYYKVNNNSNLLVLSLNALKNIHHIIYKQYKISLRHTNIVNNIGQVKWYAKVYKEFKKETTSEVEKQYNIEKVIDHFDILHKPLLITNGQSSNYDFNSALSIKKRRAYGKFLMDFNI